MRQNLRGARQEFSGRVWLCFFLLQGTFSLPLLAEEEEEALLPPLVSQGQVPAPPAEGTPLAKNPAPLAKNPAPLAKSPAPLGTRQEEPAQVLEVENTQALKADLSPSQARPRKALEKKDPEKKDPEKKDPERTEARTVVPGEPTDLSAFERQLQAYVDPLMGRPVRQFGYDVFERLQPVAVDIPVGSDYVLGTGDNLVVSIWGNLVDQDYRVTIGSEGEVRLPQIGFVPLRGLRVSEAEAVLKRKFDQILKNYNLELRLGRLRDMSVHIIGRVNSPGRVRVPSVATLLDALGAAGGVSKDGTLRKVLVRRQGQETRVIDLYSYLMEGDLSVDVSLAPNDAIVVPAVGSRVAIVGRVLRPGIYELNTDEITFDALLLMAGGYARLGNRLEIQVESPSANGLAVRAVSLVSSPPQAVHLRDGEVVLVRNANPKLENVIYVTGNVSMPGRYAYREGMRVSDVLTDQALIEAGFWVKRNAPGAADAESPLPEPFLEYALIRRIEQPTQQERRISFHLGEAILEKNPLENHLLEPQDTIVVFSRGAFERKQTVFIGGAVQKPGDYKYCPGLHVRDLVRMAGGLLPEAHLSNAMLTRTFPDQAGARFQNVALDLALVMQGEDTANLALQPNDALSVQVVPYFRKPSRVEILGEVRQPGTYTVIPGERLSEVLKRAGGFTEKAYLPGGQLYRESVRVLQQARLNESLQKLELETKAASQRFTTEAAATGDETTNVQSEQARIEKLIATIRAAPAKGRMVIRLNTPELLAGTENDLELLEGDRLLVPRQPQEVHVVGAVFNQTSLLYQKGLTIEDYFRQCGGPSGTADMASAYVIRADGSADSAQSARKGYRWDSNRARYSKGDLLGLEMLPGDTLVVPYDVKPQLSTLGLTKTVTQILFQTALATGVIIALI